MHDLEPCSPRRAPLGTRLSAALVALVPQVAVDRALEGRWVAEARIGPEAMTLVLDVARRGDALDARITVPAERVLGLRVEAFRREKDSVSFRIPHPDHPMDFAGVVAGEDLDGRLAMGDRELALAFRRGGDVPAPPYREIEVEFPGEGRTVRGSLLVPPGEGALAAIALFHATSGGGRDYVRFWADLAARQGLAALIYDRREVPVDLARMTRADFLSVAADAEAAARFLRARDGVDAARVGVGGLSQGAWIASIVAARVPEVAFVLALSPPGVPLHEIDLHQSALRLAAAGAGEADLARARALLADLFAASRGERADHDELRRRVDEMRRAPWAATLALPDEVPPPPALLRWSAHDLDPADFFARVKAPVFLAFGERDERLPVEACATRLARTLASAGNASVRLERCPGASHALFPAPQLDEHVAEWLRAR